MFNPSEILIQAGIQRLQTGYRQTFGSYPPEVMALLSEVARTALGAIARSDAPYHDLDHTLLVTLVGQDILRGKHLKEGNVTPQDWLNAIVALLCHDVGYIRGACADDQPAARRYATGSGSAPVTLPPGTTDASLTPYHVNRSQQFVEENFADHPLLCVETVKRNIEATRFPVVEVGDAARNPYPALVRAADLVGQLSDPLYLQKLPALFREFEEIGANQKFGYRRPEDLRRGFPAFYRAAVAPHVQEAIRYLRVTPEGRKVVAHLCHNLRQAGQEQTLNFMAA